MTQADIVVHLKKLRYAGKWSITQLAKESGVSRATLSNAYHQIMSVETQVRLTRLFRVLPEKAPEKPPRKRKPGHMKRYLIRYYNLSRWCDILEREPGITQVYKRKRRSNMTRDEAAYTCCKLDYIMKKYILELWGPELKKLGFTLGDCYPAERWAKLVLEKAHTRKELAKKIMHRGGNNG